MEKILLFIIITFVLGIYFIPTIISWNREHHQGPAIILINLFLGWTLLGWIAALVLALTETKGTRDPEKTCPKCAELIKAAAKICRFCQHEFADETEPAPDGITPQ